MKVEYHFTAEHIMVKVKHFNHTGSAHYMLKGEELDLPTCELFTHASLPDLLTKANEALKEKLTVIKERNKIYHKKYAQSAHGAYRIKQRYELSKARVKHE